MTSQQADDLFDGDYANFHTWLESIEDLLSAHTVKNKSFDAEAPICFRNFYVMANLYKLPPKDVNFENGWTMDQLLTETETQFGPNPLMRNALDAFETKVYDDKSASQVLELQYIVLSKILSKLGPRVPERLDVDRNDPFCGVRLLHSLISNWRKYAIEHSDVYINALTTKCQSWTGGSASEFRNWIFEIQKMLKNLPPGVHYPMDQAINLTMSAFKKDKNLTHLFTLVKLRYCQNKADVTFKYLEESALIVLEAVEPPSPHAAMPHDEPVASHSSYFSKTKRRAPDYEPVASPKKRTVIIPKMEEKQFKALSEEDRQVFVKARRLFNPKWSGRRPRQQNQGSSHNSKGGRDDKSNFAGMSCFHTEVINLLDVPTASQKSDEGEKDTQPEFILLLQIKLTPLHKRQNSPLQEVHSRMSERMLQSLRLQQHSLREVKMNNLKWAHTTIFCFSVSFSVCLSVLRELFLRCLQQCLLLQQVASNFSRNIFLCLFLGPQQQCRQ